MGFREFSRTERVSEQLRRELAEVLVTESSDPRLSSVTVSNVEVSKDLSHAKVYVIVQEGVDRDRVMAALKRAAGYLRHTLARRVHLRSMPVLRFEHDEALENALRLTSLIDRAVAAGSASTKSENDPDG